MTTNGSGQSQNTLSSYEEWPSKKYVLIDLDSVLINSDLYHQFWQFVLPQEYCKKNNTSLDKAINLVKSERSAVANTLKLNSIDYWQERLNLDIFGLLKKHTDVIRLADSAEKMLFYLSGLIKRGKAEFRLFLLSNDDPSILDLKAKLLGLDCFFDHIDSSYPYKFSTANINFWQKYFSNYKITPKKAVLFDNNANTKRIVKPLGLDVITTNLSNGLSVLLPEDRDLVYA